MFFLDNNPNLKIAKKMLNTITKEEMAKKTKLMDRQKYI